MASETTHILLTKLNFIASDEAKYPGLERLVINNLIKELEHLKKILESAETCQGSQKTIGEKWEKLLDDIYSLEDDIETLLCRKMLQGHEGKRRRHTSTRFTSEVFSSKKIEQLADGVRNYCNEILPSSSSDSRVVQSQPTDSEDRQVPPAELIPPAKSSTGSEGFQVSADKEAVLPNAAMVNLTDLVKKLNQQVLSRLTLQYLILTVDGAYLGRAILLWTVYNADDIKQHFQCRAWVRVSEELGQREILHAILKKVTYDKDKERLLLQSPQRSLHDFLVSKRYLIVLYGVQTAEFWDNIKAAFPYSLNGSRVIIVVHSGSVARQINPWIVGNHCFSNLNKLKEQLLDGWPQSSTYLGQEYGITGVKAAIDKLSQSILNPHILLFLILIKGSVGSGRTTLLWPIYNAKDVKEHFQCRAWVHVPEVFNENDILTKILEQVASVKLKEELTVELLQKRLHNFLAHKRYLVVFYDVWTSKIWDNLRRSLPNSFNGSRVIFTLGEGEVNKAPKTNPSISGMIPVRKSQQDVHEDVPDQKGVQHCDRLSDVKDEESSIVGLDDKVKELAELTLNSYKLHLLISVLGAAGSGKTTLVKTIYNSVASKRNFKCRAWVSVPPKLDELNERQLLIDILGQLRNAKQEQSLGLEQLRERLHLFLTWKRYLIVLDDISTPDAWERLNLVFPNLSNGSRVIITTPNAYLAYHINPETIVLQLRPLTDEESWELFSKKVKQNIDDSKLSEQEKKDDSKLAKQEKKDDSKLREKILQRCHGHPLQIVLLRGLSMAASGEDQSKFLDEMPFLDIIALAYQDLAPTLRCCLLYMGLFPKSYEIPIRRLYQLWLAEGFLIPTDLERTPEELAKKYFEELKSRNMIEVTRLKLNGSDKTCRVPTTIYDTLFLKNGFFHISNSSGTWGSPCSNIRRLSENLVISLLSKDNKNRVKRLRSYISFYGKIGDAPTYRVKELLSKVVDEGGFGMLVVLDLEGVYKPALSDTLGKLQCLKYLGLRRTLLDDVPQSVGDLSHLETLDIKHTFITKLPSTIWKAKELQHLYMSDVDVDMSTLKRATCGSLNNLKILWGLVIRNQIPHKKWMTSLGGLRKLKLTCNEASIEGIASWISKMDNLQSLNLRLIDKFNQPLELSVEDMQTWKQTSLSQLYLLAKLPREIATTDFPVKVEILTLSMTHLSVDPMEMLGKLEKLKVLKLYAQSFLGLEMTCHHDGFPELRVLKLWMLHKLSGWTVQDGTMRMLRELEIRCCKNLRKPDGLEKLTSLKELTLTNMKEDFVANVERSMGSNVAIMKNNFFSSSWE